jgi:hypothetical protein
MAHASDIEPQTGPRTLGGGYLFGIPMGQLGWFASLLIGGATGFMAFFIGTFLGILGIPLYNSATHHAVDMSWTYKAVGLPFGFAVLVLAWGYLGMLWVKRTFRTGLGGLWVGRLTRLGGKTLCFVKAYLCGEAA